MSLIQQAARIVWINRNISTSQVGIGGLGYFFLLEHQQHSYFSKDVRTYYS